MALLDNIKNNDKLFDEKARAICKKFNNILQENYDDIVELCSPLAYSGNKEKYNTHCVKCNDYSTGNYINKTILVRRDMDYCLSLHKMKDNILALQFVQVDEHQGIAPRTIYSRETLERIDVFNEGIDSDILTNKLENGLKKYVRKVKDL